MFRSIAAGLGFMPDANRRPAWDAFAAALRLAVRTQATRRALPDLPDRLLADIGISRAAALAEAERLPWDLAPRRYR